MVNLASIRHVADLAKLELTEAELQLYSEQLSAIIEHFEQLAAIPTADVALLTTPSEIIQHFRPDVVHVSDVREQLFKNAPEKTGYLFKVPPVV